MLSRVVRLLAATAMVLAVTGCDGDEPPAPTPTTTTSPTESPTNSPTVPAYLHEYSEEERAAYEAAVSDYRTFAKRNARIYAEGEATPAARSFYRKYTAAWQSYWARLLEFERQGYEIQGRGRIIRVRPVSVRVSEEGGGEILLRVCGVASGVTVLQNGEPVPQPTPVPTNVRVRMEQLPNETWWRVLDQKAGSPC